MTRLKIPALLVTASLVLFSPAMAPAATIAVVANAVPGGTGLGVRAPCTVTCPGPEVFMREALETTRAELNTIASLDDGSVVRVVKLDPAVDAQAQAISDAFTDARADIAKLQAAIEADEAFRLDLDESGILLDSVIAADLAGNGTLILYTAGPGAHSSPITF
jgi:hypothetical protein